MMSKRAPLALALGCALILSAGACTNSYTKRFQEGPSDYSSKTGEQHELPNQRMLQAPNEVHASHNNATFDMDNNASQVINDLRGIRDSFVAVAGSNAYVAIILDNSATGTKGKGKLQYSDRTITSSSMNDVSNKSYRLQPGMVVMDKYSHITIPNDDDIASELQIKIADTIRTLHPEVSHVHISANGHFINALSRYAQMTWQGQPVSGQIASFNELVARYFP